MENNVRPHLSLLTEEQIAQVHQYALRILAKVGIRVDSPSVLGKLKRTRLVEVDDRCVKISAELVESALRSAPGQIQVFDRSGNPAFTLGDGSLHFGIGVTALYYLDPETDSPEPFARRHMRAMVRLGSALPQYDVVSTVGIVQDVPTSLSDLYAALEMVANTTKPLVVLVSEEKRFGAVLSLIEALSRQSVDRPFVLPYFNPVSPLVLNEGTLDKMALTVERGLPFIFSSYSMAGMSTPMTPAGTLALLMAELLAGLTISQVLKAGTPILIGMLPNYFDMKTMQSFYDPQSILLNLACAEMMAHYGLPHCGTSGSGTGWGADFISADTYWMNTLTYCLNQGGLAPFVGDTLGAKAFSPNTVVYVHEIIDQARRVASGFALEESSMVFDEIASAGPGGSFLSSASTKGLFKTGYYQSPIWPRWSMEKWQSENMPDAKELLRARTINLIESAPAPEDYEELIGKGQEFINNLHDLY